MQNNVEEYCPISPANIDLEQFTLSLISECVEQSLLTESQVEKIHLDLMTMLSDRILQYTNGTSNSVKSEIAQTIFQSMLYCCDVYLLSLPSIKQAVDSLSSITVLYSNGLSTVRKYIKLTKDLLLNMKRTKLLVNNTTYNSTIEQGFNDYLQNYNENFDAQHNYACMDYPILFDNMKQTGVIYIKNYLQKLELENEFCRNFAPDDINCFLSSYAARCKISSNDLFENITELLLKNALCATMLGKREITIFITIKECELLRDELYGLSEAQCHDAVSIALATLLKRTDASDSLKKYLSPYIEIMTSQLFNAALKNELSKIILV